MRHRHQLTVLQLASALLLAAGPGGATTYYVDRLTDSTIGACTPAAADCALRGAIVAANAHPGDDVIVLGAGTFELSLPGWSEDEGLTGDLDVTDTLLIVGLGPELSVIDARGIDRVIDVHATGGRLTLRGVTVTGGALPPYQDDGGIRALAGALRLETCGVSGNVAEQGHGGAIASISTGAGDRTEIIDSWITGNSSEGTTLHILRLLLERSTVSGNVSTSNAPALTLYDYSSLRDSTISGHTTPHFSGGVAINGNELTIAGCTLAGNSGSELYIGDTASVEMSNTLIVGTCNGMVQPGSIGGNLESPGHTCGLGANDLEDVADPRLADLGFHGGPAPVHQLLPGSPALDATIAGHECHQNDQRQLARPRDGDGNGAADCDIGAVEMTGAGEIFVDTFECGFFTSWSAVDRGTGA